MPKQSFALNFVYRSSIALRQTSNSTSQATRSSRLVMRVACFGRSP